MHSHGVYRSSETKVCSVLVYREVGKVDHHPAVADMLLAILSICSQEELDTDSDDDDKAENKEEKAAEEIRQRREQIRKKILAVGKMQRVFSLLRWVPLCTFYSYTKD